MSSVADRLKVLRSVLSDEGLKGLIVPLTDEHMSEYVGAYANRMAYISGFTGSAGLVMVLADKAAVFTDGRYTIQVREQVDGTLFDYETLDQVTPARWLAANTGAGDKIGYDGELLRTPFREKLSAALVRKNASLVMTDGNLIDRIWEDQPGVPLDPAFVFSDDYAGESAKSKRERLAADLAEKNIDVAPVMLLDSIAWLLNVRGGDVAHTPVVRSAALLHKSGHVDLFIEQEKVTDDVRAHLGNGVTVNPRDGFYPALEAIAAEGKSVLFDGESHNTKMHDLLVEGGAKLVDGTDPCVLPKAIKNQTELAGTRTAHERDAVAIARFLHWIDQTGPSGALDELACVEKLWAFRTELGGLKDSSFDTISGAGPNAALPHYRVTQESNRVLAPDSIYLCDSGGQYLDGTTDITRTVVIGNPTAKMREHFTRVLRGHIALATTVFARGTSGHALDSIARRPLWEAGLDYDHGTGHGVGSFLAVHEGPQRIAKFGSNQALEPGMILSNEPGYYLEGQYGIRIENLIIVEPWQEDPDGDMLQFSTITLAPIDRRLIEPALMSEAEIAWLNRYHARVYDTLKDKVPGDIKQWLADATAPLEVALAA